MSQDIKQDDAPEADTHMVLVNQPVHYLDAPTWYVFSYGGDIANLANGELIAHEMGNN